MISVAELECLFSNVKMIAPGLAEFSSETIPDISRLGGTQKIAVSVEERWSDFFTCLPENGKITIGVSDFSRGASAFLAQKEALHLKRLLAKTGRSVRVVPNKAPVLSSATSLHNHLFSETKIEFLKLGRQFYRVIQLQDIENYARRDRERPARDAKVGMLPPKLAQILINLCGNLPAGARLLDPFCGTGVVLQEAALMGYVPYGTDLNERMIEYSQKNLQWLKTQERRLTKVLVKNALRGPLKGKNGMFSGKNVVNLTTLIDRAVLAVGDAQNYQWQTPINAVACETYLGPPMSLPPVDIKLKQAKQECSSIILHFLRNLAGQITSGTPVVIAVPAWLRPDGHYERLNILDEIAELRYNVYSFKNLGQDKLLYHREGQVVTREIIVLRKK